MQLLSVKQVRERLGGCGVTRIYELLGQKRLVALKLHGRTLITEESLEKLIASLPRAVISTRPRRERTKGARVRERL